MGMIERVRGFLPWSEGGSKQSSTVMPRPSPGQGPWTNLFQEWVARSVDPHFYEAIREALPPIDAAINRLTTIDGVVRVRGNNARLVAEVQEILDQVPVGDFGQSFQEFYQQQGNELYEQGHAIGEVVLDNTGRDVDHLAVADSKGTLFWRERTDQPLRVFYRPPMPRTTRGDGTDNIERVMRNRWAAQGAGRTLGELGYREIDPARLAYAGYQVENGNPYGVSLIRSCEFAAKILLTMDNSTLHTWQRFGDPPFHLTYKTRINDPEKLEKRKNALAKDLKDTLAHKRRGDSADFVTAVGQNDEIEISVIGADNQVLKIEEPARHILEQVVAKSGLAAWMLGFHWSTAERLAERQGQIMLQESRVRWETRRGPLHKIIATILRARGRTWRPGDWELYQELPNIQDLVAEAQARFLHAQADQMEQGIDTSRLETGQRAAVTRSGDILMPYEIRDREVVDGGKHTGCHGHKDTGWAEDDAELPRLETQAERGMLAAWSSLEEKLRAALDLPSPGKQLDASFSFDPAMVPEIRALEEEFIDLVGGEDGPLAQSSWRSWVRGAANAATEFGADPMGEARAERWREQVMQHAMQQVRDTTVRSFREGIVSRLAEREFDGMAPADVARQLRQRFAAGDYDWHRLARSEIADQHGIGKLAQYDELGLTEYDWVPAPGACALCLGIAAGGPYPIATGPRPMADSHPNCRCTVAGRNPETAS